MREVAGSGGINQPMRRVMRLTISSYRDLLVFLTDIASTRRKLKFAGRPWRSSRLSRAFSMTGGNVRAVGTLIEAIGELFCWPAEYSSAPECARPMATS